MFGKTITLFLGLAVVLLVAALVLPQWHATTFDEAGRLRTFSGLWRQVLQLSDTPPDPAGYCASVPDDVCKSNGAPLCKWDNDRGACMSKDVLCGRTTTKAACDANDGGPDRCHWSGDKCRHMGSFGDELDVSMPWSGDGDTRTAMAVTRTLGIVAAAVAFVTLFIAGGSSTPRPLLVSMLGGTSAAATIAALAVYSAKLTHSFDLSEGIEDALDADMNPLPPIGTHNFHIVKTLRQLINAAMRSQYPHGEQLYHQPVTTAQGASYYMAVAAVLALIVVSILGIVDRRAMYN